jgi:two-component system, chemotaxis family, sensor kinase CheA
MKLQPQDWTQLADIKAVRIPRPGERAIGTIRRRPRDRAGSPTPTTAPLALRRPVRPLLAVPILAIALWAWWLAAQHGAAALRGALAGSGITAALLLPLVLCLWRRARALAAEAATARRQQLNILGGLREGLFLIGRDLRLSATCSASTSEVLRLSAPAGRRLEDVLRPLLEDEETLAAALTFLQLLWNDEADEDAIESLNPLQQVPVFFSDARGARERRHLSFSFRRVVSALPADDCILGAVADVTDRVLLAKELEQAEADGDSQAELLLQLVRTDPITLVKFLDDADTAFRKSNAILTAPGSGPQQLHKRLIGVLRELDAITTAAEALPFASFAQRLQSIDDVLSGLCGKTPLTGNDFLPVVVRLDELMSHAATMRTVHQHIVLLRAASAALAGLDQRESSHITGPVMLDLS